VAVLGKAAARGHGVVRERVAEAEWLRVYAQHRPAPLSELGIDHVDRDAASRGGKESFVYEGMVCGGKPHRDAQIGSEGHGHRGAMRRGFWSSSRMVAWNMVERRARCRFRARAAYPARATRGRGRRSTH